MESMDIATKARDPLRVTEDSVDPRFDDPYIDVEEWRNDPYGRIQNLARVRVVVT